MKQTLKDFLQEFYTFSKKRLFWLTTGLFASSALEGISLLLVIPFLYAAGISGSPSALHGGATIPLATSKEGHALLIILFVYLLMIIGQEFLKRYTSITITALKAGFSRHLSDRFYEAFARSKWQVIIAQRRSDIANALTNELKTIDVGTQVLMQTGSVLPSALIQLVISFVISPPVTLCALAMGLLFYFCMKPMNKKLGNLADTLNSVLKDSLSDINEHLGGMKEIKGYGAEQVHLQRFARKTKETEERFVQFVSMFSTSNFLSCPDGIHLYRRLILPHRHCPVAGALHDIHENMAPHGFISDRDAVLHSPCPGLEKLFSPYAGAFLSPGRVQQQQRDTAL